MEVDYLVTGGAGFIGCALSAELLRERPGLPTPKIVAVDNLHPQIHRTAERPADLPSAVDLHVMDVCDAESWDKLLREIRPRAIVHLAAETGTGQSLDLPVRHTHVNVTGTAEMLEGLNRANWIPEHILLSSSRAVYGEGAWRDRSDDSVFYPPHRSRQQLEAGQFDISAPSGAAAEPLPHDDTRVHPRPISVYGATKLTQEHLLSAWCAARGVPLSVLRFQNVYGAGQSPHNPYTGIIGLFHRLAAAGASIEIYEDGEIGRDFIYIDDVANAVAAALHLPTDRVIDIGSGEPITIGRAAHIISEMYDAPAPRVSGAFRYGDVRWAVCDTQAMQQKLGALAEIDFVEGNKMLSEWLVETGTIDR